MLKSRVFLGLINVELAGSLGLRPFFLFLFFFFSFSLTSFYGLIYKMVVSLYTRISVSEWPVVLIFSIIVSV